MKRKLHYGYICVVAILIIIASWIGVKYISLSTRDIPVMDTWRNYYEMIPLLMNGNLTFADIWSGYIGHRNPLEMLLLCCYILFFKANCQIASFLGLGVLIATAALIAKCWKGIVDRMSERSSQTALGYVLVIPIFLVFATLGQWEILTLEFSASFQTRIMWYICLFAALDRAIFMPSRYAYLGIGISAAAAICLVSQLYFVAMLLSMAVILGFDTIVVCEHRKNRTAQLLQLLLPCIAASVVYFYDLQIGGLQGSSNSFLHALFDGSMFVSIMYAFAGSVLEDTIVTAMTSTNVVILGIILTMLIIAAIVLYLKNKMYCITYFPALLAGYGLISTAIIAYGRLNMFQASYLASSRYVCESRLIWVGVLMVYAMSMMKIDKSWIKRGLLAIPVVVILLAIVKTDQTEMKTAPYRGYYKDDLIQKVMQTDIEACMDEEFFSPFQASGEYVRGTVQYMKEYSLGVFSR